MELAAAGLSIPPTAVRHAVSVLVIGFFHAPDKGDDSARFPRAHLRHENHFCLRELFLALHLLQDVGGEDKGLLQVALPLADIPEELGLLGQEVLSPSDLREVTQGEAARDDLLVKALHTLVLCVIDAAVMMCAIILMDGLSKDTLELPICSSERLQEPIGFPKFLFCPHTVCDGHW